jgi:hypothetical protein
MQDQLSIWQFFWNDLSFLGLNTIVLVAFVLALLVAGRRYRRFFTLQREALEHRKTADARVLAQNQNFEQLISQHYATTNAHNQETLAKASEALRINAEALAQVTTMNRTLARIAERLERNDGPTQGA